MKSKRQQECYVWRIKFPGEKIVNKKITVPCSLFPVPSLDKILPGNGLIVALLISFSLIFMSPALAASDATQVNVSLGNSVGELKFFPNHFEFVAGKKYKLILDNPSPTKHYFTSKDFADASWTQKVEAGKVEVKGAIHELELKPGAVAEWVLIPLKGGTYELHCSVAGHSEAGMTGDIVINAQ